MANDQSRFEPGDRERLPADRPFARSVRVSMRSAAAVAALLLVDLADAGFRARPSPWAADPTQQATARLTTSASLGSAGSSSVLQSSLTRAGKQTNAIAPITVSRAGITAVATPSGAPAHSFGIWTPSKWDTCTKEQHDAYTVIGPEGKRYPTWHPALGPGGCSFGHEHGRDPRNSELWTTKQIQQFFYYDANGNGQMDAVEEAVTGIPFGYANEQLDAWGKANGKQTLMRHEDHVGHKVEYANGEGDMATHQMSSSTRGGVWVGKLGNDVVLQDTGVRCYYLAKPHQGVSTADALTNNVHEVFYFADCRAPNSAHNQTISLATLVAFGKPGGFTSFMPLCGIERRGSSQDFVNLGTNATNAQYPTGPGDREIITRQCVEVGFLVPEGMFSGNLYEAWPASLGVTDASGRQLVSGINLLFDVEDANRYYYSDSLKAQRGYENPDAGPNRGFTMDLCYDTSLPARAARGGPCADATNHGAIRNITWDDPRAAFRGLHRGMYFMPGVLKNVGGSESVYTDPFGKNGRKKPFPGSVRQQISAKNLDYSNLIGGQAIDPRVNDRFHEDGKRTVHAPN